MSLSAFSHLQNSNVYAVTEAKHGTFVYLRQDTYVGKSLEKYGEWSEEEVALLQHFCKAGDWAIEAGTNIGTHTVPLAKMIGPQGKLFAFEAQPVIFRIMCTNIVLNNLTNVETRNHAVSDRAGSLKIPNFDYSTAENWGAMRVDGHSVGQDVSMVALDEAVASASLKLIKADIEGVELELLKGSTKLLARHRPVIYLESDYQAEKALEVHKLLLDQNYALYWHVPLLFNAQNHRKVTENIFKGYASFNILCLPQEKMSLPSGLAYLKQMHTPMDKPF